MNLDIFKDLLFDNDDEMIEKYMKSEEVQKTLLISTDIAVIKHTLIEKEITTIERLEELKQLYGEEIEKGVRDRARKDLDKLKNKEDK